MDMKSLTCIAKSEELKDEAESNMPQGLGFQVSLEAYPCSCVSASDPLWLPPTYLAS